MTLQDKTALVTGAGQGIGLGIAKKLAKEGCNIVVVDLNEERAGQAANELQAFGVKTLVVRCDVSNQNDVNETINLVKQQFNSVDILVNNAGIYPFRSFIETAETDWDRVLNVNLKSCYLVTKAVLEIMPDNGRVINISSAASLIGMSSLSAYCASKAGINGLTRALAIELAPRNITVNAVAPGAVNTPGTAAPDEVKQQTLMAIPIKRMGEPEDVANAVAFLASAETGYITGQIISVDGGWTVW